MTNSTIFIFLWYVFFNEISGTLLNLNYKNQQMLENLSTQDSVSITDAVYINHLFIFFMLHCIWNNSLENAHSQKCLWDFIDLPQKEQRNILEILILTCLILDNLPSQSDEILKEQSSDLLALFLPTVMFSVKPKCLKQYWT